jgi:hypothetical protein
LGQIRSIEHLHKVHNVEWRSKPYQRTDITLLRDRKADIEFTLFIPEYSDTHTPLKTRGKWLIRMVLDLATLESLCQYLL